MKNKDCFKEFIKYTVLSVLGTLGVSCYVFTDTLFISMGMGENGLTALNLAIPVYSLMYGCCIMLGVGGGTRYAIAKGEGNDEKANSVFTSTVVFGAMFSLAFFAAGIFFSGELARLLGANDAVFEMTKIYLRVLLTFAPAFFLNNILVCFVRNDGNPRLAMAATLTGSLSNVLLDYIFIFPLNMNIFGAVLATVISPIISVLILSLHIITKNNSFHFSIRGFKAYTALSCAGTGTSSLIGELATAVVIIIFNMLILELKGNTGVAAYSIIANLAIVAVAIMTGISQGIQPIISRSCGEGNYLYIKQTLRYGLISAILLSGIIYLVFFVFAEPIASIFNSEQNRELQQTAVLGLKLYFTAIPFAAFNIVICNYFAAVKRAVPAAVISLLKSCLLLIPAAFILSYLFRLNGIWLSYPAAEVLTAVVSLVLFKRSDITKG